MKKPNTTTKGLIGVSAIESMDKCPVCGKKYLSKRVFVICPYCGKKTGVTQTNSN